MNLRVYGGGCSLFSLFLSLFQCVVCRRVFGPGWFQGTQENHSVWGQHHSMLGTASYQLHDCVGGTSCYAKVISVDEASCSWWYWLIIGVDIEQHGSKDAILGKAISLFPPPALFAIQLNIEASVFQKQLDQLCQMEVFRHVIQFAEESSVVDSVI